MNIKCAKMSTYKVSVGIGKKSITAYRIGNFKLEKNGINVKSNRSRFDINTLTPTKNGSSCQCELVKRTLEQLFSQKRDNVVVIVPTLLCVRQQPYVLHSRDLAENPARRSKRNAVIPSNPRRCLVRVIRVKGQSLSPNTVSKCGRWRWNRGHMSARHRAFAPLLRVRGE
jgi:hypothetical protein